MRLPTRSRLRAPAWATSGRASRSASDLPFDQVAGHVGDQPFAVLLGDDLIDPRETLLSRMLDVRDRRLGSVIALMEAPPEQIHRYGCATVEPTGEEDVVRVTGPVEKPARQHAPSRYAVIGRYVLDRAVFSVLERTPPGRGGEIQLTDALREPAAGCTVRESSSRACATTPTTRPAICGGW
ncbi:sugar phosphate nucleotidyltransferase [Streptomyces sp. NPDC093598]|uniref:sugar phosphate nucleotidyltransferase n=1 Tax=Streptomyces sp. NPDC093598 TaxID=3366046 RepID=UPI0037F105BC